MERPRSVAVFCGAKSGSNPQWAEAAQHLGEGLAGLKIRLVYGGGMIGLMGQLADATLAAGGQVLGVIPRFLTYSEVAHTGVDALVVTDSMHERKRHMFDQSDAFVMMPGAVGTFDETIEVITWRQLKLHDKPILIANIAGSADAFLALLEDAIAHGFMAADNRSLYRVVDSVAAVLEALRDLRQGAAEDSEKI